MQPPSPSAALAAARRKSTASELLDVDYRPEADVDRLASYFNQKYGSLDAALRTFDRSTELNLCAFELALKKWGVRVDNVVELFAHFDLDFSGTISLAELFRVLELPIQDIQERELQRQRAEVKRVYEALAHGIRETFGSIEEALAGLKHTMGLSAGGGALSLAKFRHLLKELGLELEAALLQRVFREIDEDNTGSITVQELQKALSYHLVRDSLVELAKNLIARHGSIPHVFQELGELPALFSPGSRRTPRRAIQNMQVNVGMEDGSVSCIELPQTGNIRDLKVRVFHVMSIPIKEQRLAMGGRDLDGDARSMLELAGGNLEEALSVSLTQVKQGDMSAQDPMPAAPLPVSEKEFFSLLRKLKVFEQLTDETAKLMYSSMTPFTIEDFVRRLHQEHAEHLEEEQRKKEERERREREEQKHIKDAMRTDRTREVRQEVEAWVAHVAVRDGARAAFATGEPLVTGAWASAARGGISRTQLKDYVLHLGREAENRHEEVEELRGQLELAERDAEVLQEFMVGPAPPLHAALHSLRSSEATPMMSPITPGSAYPTPGSRIGKSPRTPTVNSVLPKAVSAERMIQAAAVGDVASLERCVGLHRADVNVPGWGGVTALMSAARHGRMNAVKSLLSWRADPLRTDMRGRTAVDHALRHPSAQEWLRGCGGLSGQELRREAEALARRVLLVEGERAVLEGVKQRLPSKEVLERAQRTRQLRMGAGGALLSPRSSPRASLTADSTPAAWPAGAQLLGFPSFGVQSQSEDTSPGGSPTLFGAAAGGARPGADTKPKTGKHVTLTLPVDQRSSKVRFNGC